MLEQRAAKLAAQRATPKDIEDMRAALRAFDAATDLLERARYDVAFHALIARSAHNPVIEMMFGSIAPLVFDLMLRSLDDTVVVALGVPYHEETLRAIEAGDGETASKAMERHVSLADALFGTDLDAPLHTLAQRKIAGLLGPGVVLEDVVAEALSVAASLAEQAPVATGRRA